MPGKQTALNTPAGELAFSYFNEINIIAQLSGNAFARILPEGLTQSQFAVLNWFNRVDDQATPGRLAKAFMVTKGAMTNTLGKLEQKGFVQIVVDQNSGRQKIVTITPLGLQARLDALAAAAPLMAEVLEQFSVADIQQQLPGLQRMRKYLDKRRETT